MLKKTLHPCALALSLTLVLCALPVSAQQQDVMPGLDLFESQPGTRVEFWNDPLPAGFFPGCDEEFAGEIPLVGKPIAANKPLGTADSILHRLDGVPEGNGTTGLIIEALCLQNTDWTDPCGGDWNVWVRLAEDQPITQLTMRTEGSEGGTFDTVVAVKGVVSFSRGSEVLGPVQDFVTLSTDNAVWTYAPPPGGVVATGPTLIDSDCDGVVDKSLMVGTSNFHIGELLHVSDQHPVLPPVINFPPLQNPPQPF